MNQEKLTKFLSMCAGLTPATKEYNPGIGAGMLNTIILEANELLSSMPRITDVATIAAEEREAGLN